MDFLALVFDAIIVLIFVSCILDGRKKGFVEMILSVIAVIFCFAVAEEFSQSVAVWVNDNFVHAALSSGIADAINNNLNEGTQAMLTAIPQAVIDTLVRMGFSVEEMLAGVSSQANIAQAAESITTAAEGSLVLPLLNIISFIVIFAMCRFVCAFIIKIVGAFFKLPIIKGMNKFAGGIIGAVKGLIIVAVVSAVACGAARLLPDMPLAQAINNSTLINTIAQTVIELSAN